MTRGQFDDGAAAQLSPHPFCRFPGLKKFLAGQALGLAYGPADPRKEGVADEDQLTADEAYATGCMPGCMANKYFLTSKHKYIPIFKALQTFFYRREITILVFMDCPPGRYFITSCYCILIIPMN